MEKNRYMEAHFQPTTYSTSITGKTSYEHYTRPVPHSRTCFRISPESTSDSNFQANGIKIGPQHSPANPNMPAGQQGGSSSGGCC